MQLTIEQSIFKSYYETKIYNQVQTKFRTLFPERLPPNKTTTRKNVENYESMRGMARSGRRITTKKQENIEAVRQ